MMRTDQDFSKNNKQIIDNFKISFIWIQLVLSRWGKLPTLPHFLHYFSLSYIYLQEFSVWFCVCLWSCWWYHCSSEQIFEKSICSFTIYCKWHAGTDQRTPVFIFDEHSWYTDGRPFSGGKDEPFTGRSWVVMN